MLRERESRPTATNGDPAQSISTAIKSEAILANLDAMAEHLRGRFVVQVEIDGDKFRTHVFRSTAAAERCVHRARERGKRAHVTLVQMLPVGVVAGMGSGPA